MARKCWLYFALNSSIKKILKSQTLAVTACSSLFVLHWNHQAKQIAAFDPN